MYAIYMVTFTINIPPMLAYIPYMDPMGIVSYPYYNNIIIDPWFKKLVAPHGTIAIQVVQQRTLGCT